VLRQVRLPRVASLDSAVILRHEVCKVLSQGRLGLGRWVPRGPSRLPSAVALQRSGQREGLPGEAAVHVNLWQVDGLDLGLCFQVIMERARRGGGENLGDTGHMRPGLLQQLQ
jgi:hypothetical protein